MKISNLSAMWYICRAYKKYSKDEQVRVRALLSPYADYEVETFFTKRTLNKFILTLQEKGLAPSSINRALSSVNLLQTYYITEVLPLYSKEVTFEPIKVKWFKEHATRVRYLTKPEVEHLLVNLPEHIRPLVLLTLYTGLRKSNVLNLKWSQVDLENKLITVNPDQSKSGHAIGVPLNEQACQLLLRLKTEESTSESYVFTHNGKKISEANTKEFRRAVKACGITNFRWHDLRHTWASWHVQAGTPLNVLMELGGWHSLSMVLRYAHLNNSTLRRYAEEITL